MKISLITGHKADYLIRKETPELKKGFKVFLTLAAIGSFIGFILAWIYYKTHSLIPCILIHIMNNSLSVYLALKFPDVEYSSELIGEKAYLTGLVIAFLLFILSWRMMNTYKLSNTTTEI